MIMPWSPVVFLDISGSVLMLLLSFCCAVLSRQLTRQKPDDVFHSYIFLFTLAILFFAVSRSFGHLVKQLLLMNDMKLIWQHISPFSGAINSTTFVVIFAFGISFHRFQKTHMEIEYYRNNLEELISKRTEELQQAKNTLQNILNNSNPINITSTNFDLVEANRAYYELWPRTRGDAETLKCYESRPGLHCHTEQCPMKQIIDGRGEVTQEVSKDLNGSRREFLLTAKPFRDVDGKLIGMVESFQDITLRKRAEDALRESEERFRKIFFSNPDPVILAKLDDGTIIDVNKAFESATGISQAEAIGRNSEELNLWVDSDARKSFREMLQDHGEVNNYESAFRVQDGQIKTGLISASLLTDKNEPCILLVIRDITAEKAAERALVAMDQMKSEFISTAAHELNTPLSNLMGYAEFLLNPDDFGGFTEEQKRNFIREIYDSGDALHRIIEDLLDISRIESGNPIPLMLEDANFPELLDKKVNNFKTLHKQHNFHLNLPGDPAKPVLLIDRQRISQALENLLHNAVKYSDAGMEITVKGREQNDGWEICIEDQGVGMTAEQLERIFDKFYRADTSNTAISGLGLGMSIVKQTIEAHGGSIRVESALGEGTRVIFKLPFKTS